MNQEIIVKKYDNGLKIWYNKKQYDEFKAWADSTRNERFWGLQREYLKDKENGTKRANEGSTVECDLE